MNSPESPIFHKSKIAYGLYQAQKYVREKDEVILVEGYFDVIALHAAGFQNVVATCGTALTIDHLKLFRKFAQEVIVLFDGDEAGISATERAMEIGLAQGAVLYGAAMPEGLDPDELLFDQQTGAPLAEGKERRWTRFLARAKPLLDARIAEQIAGRRARTRGAHAGDKDRSAQWLERYTRSRGSRDPDAGRSVEDSAIHASFWQQAMGGQASPAPRAQHPKAPHSASARTARPAAPHSLRAWPRRHSRAAPRCAPERAPTAPAISSARESTSCFGPWPKGAKPSQKFTGERAKFAPESDNCRPI